MLVLSRKVGEELRIADDIVVRVTAVNGNRVKIGVVAPKSHRIVRPEAVEKAKQRAESEMELALS